MTSCLRHENSFRLITVADLISSALRFIVEYLKPTKIYIDKSTDSYLKKSIRIETKLWKTVQIYHFNF